MRFPVRLTLALVVLAGLALAGPLASRFTARAAGDTCSAHVGGVEVGKKLVPELVLFNTTGTEFELDLLIRDALGNVLVERPGEISLGRFETLAVDLVEQLSRDLPPRTKVAAGLLQVQVTGDATFGQETVLMHVTQYYGNRKRPKAAMVLPAVYRGIVE